MFRWFARSFRLCFFFFKFKYKHRLSNTHHSYIQRCVYEKFGNQQPKKNEWNEEEAKKPMKWIATTTTTPNERTSEMNETITFSIVRSAWGTQFWAHILFYGRECKSFCSWLIRYFWWFRPFTEHRTTHRKCRLPSSSMRRRQSNEQIFARSRLALTKLVKDTRRISRAKYST